MYVDRVDVLVQCCWAGEVELGCAGGGLTAQGMGWDRVYEGVNQLMSEIGEVCCGLVSKVKVLVVLVSGCV